METSIPTTEISNRLAPVNAGVVPDDDDVAAQMAQHLAEEVGDVVAAYVVLGKSEVHAKAPSLGADRQSRDRRDPVMTVPVVDNGCLSAGGPCLSHRWDQHEP